ncbi:MAG: hypothetical protein JW936_08435 [Sedimentisphaerales bacterium]|nr:hypothetical protein [Sedimentisphaerales bacterium]
MNTNDTADGVHQIVPRERMAPSAKKWRDTYALTPNAPLIQREFGYYCLERWYNEGLDRDADLAEVFGYEPPGQVDLGGLGWCEAAFIPAFEEKVLEDRGEHELIQDDAGRSVIVFKGRRSGFMPEYVDHPVHDMKTWQENVKWRLDPQHPDRFITLDQRRLVPSPPPRDFNQQLEKKRQDVAQGLMVRQLCIGGYMYLRSLIGPEALLYKFHDEPELIHDCMQTWLELADVVTAFHQKHFTIDEIFLGEDICFNHGSLISPDMMREFLLPYYQQLIQNMKSRQLDRNRHLYVQIDTDGYSIPLIDVYRESIGMDMMSPFEVASGCDVVEVGRQWPSLIISGGIDKRVLAQGPDAIDRHLEYILPAMRKRGGYIPTCDHGVPEEVSLADYMHYRKRSLELGL